MASIVTTLKEKGPSFTTYKIAGTPAAVREAVEEIIKKYPPDGYGTRAVYSDTGAVVTHANSCD